MTPRTRLVFALVLSLAALPATAATKVFLHDALSKGLVPGGTDITVRQANSTQGSAKVTAVTDSAAGSISGQYFPSGTTGHIITKASGGTRTIWISDPLASGVTISGTITPNLWGLESAAQCNCAARYEVLRWDVRHGGIVSSLGISTDDGMGEWGTSAAVRNSPTLTPSSTAFNAGDRIVIVVYNDNAGNQGSNRNWTLDYDAGTGVDGDTYLSFTESLSFASDSNNAPSQATTSELRLGPVLWEMACRALLGLAAALA